MNLWIAGIALIVSVCKAQESDREWNIHVQETQRDIDMERNIINNLLPGTGDRLYNGDNRPAPSAINRNLPENARSSVIVQVNMYIGKALFKDGDNTADLEITMRQEWTDDRLVYGSNSDDLPEFVSLPVDQKIWLPDTYFSGSTEVSRHSQDSQFTRIEPSTGHVTFSKRVSLETMCEPSGSAFPLSTNQECHIKIGSYGNTVDKIIYLWRVQGNPIKMNDDLEDQDGYYFIESTTDTCQGNFTTGFYSCLQLVLKFGQPCYSHLIYFFLPSVLLVIASWLHFWVHGSWSVPRTLSAILPFAIFCLVLFFYERSGGSSMGAQSWWLLICVLLTFLSLLEYFAAICIGVTRPPQPAPDAERPLLNEEKDKFSSLPATTKLDYLSRLLFPVLFIVFLVVYLLCYLL